MGPYNKLLLQQAKDNKKIFWDIANINILSEEAIVERILLYGDINQFRTITKNKEEFKKIYTAIKNKKRNSLTPIVKNYVNLYLRYHA